MKFYKKKIFIIVISIFSLVFFIYLLSFLFSSETNINNSVILPLHSTLSISDLSTLFNNNLKTTITVSDKNQEVDLFLLSQDFSFFITQQDIFFKENDKSKINELSYNFYDYKISSSIEIMSNRTQIVFTKYKSGRKAKENFSLCSKNNCNKNSIKMKNFNFMLIEDPFDKISGGIGLSPNEFIGDGAINLFNELYRKKYIKNSIWYIEYDKNEAKNLIIGKFPYEINNKYNKDDFEFFGIEKKDNYWSLKMMKILIGNEDKNYEDVENVIKDRHIQFFQDYSLIYGPPEYYNKIKNIFFNKYLPHQCKENIYQYQLIEYLYISCDDNISLKDFPQLTFYINKNYKFQLIYEDLFIKNNKEILFLFMTNKNEKYFNGKWIVGTPLLKKYMPVYNQMELKIGFFGVIKEKDNYTSAGIIGLIFFFILFGIIIYLFLFIFRKYRNRKIRRAALEMKIEEISNRLILNNSKIK